MSEELHNNQAKSFTQEVLSDEGHFSSIYFLKTCSNEELEPLVKILTDTTTSKLVDSKKYKLHKPNHRQYIDDIIHDYETFGGNTFANMWREHGVGYKEILKDVCKQMKVNMPNDASVNIMEIALITKISEQAVEQMTPKELEEFAKEINPNTTDFTKQAVLTALRFAIKKSGFVAYRILTKLIFLIGKHILDKTIPFVVYQTSTKYLGMFAGPAGLALTTVWTAVDLAGPAYRVTIPATIYIASLRQAKKYEASRIKCSKCGILNEANAKFCFECGNNLNS